MTRAEMCAREDFLMTETPLFGLIQTLFKDPEVFWEVFKFKSVVYGYILSNLQPIKNKILKSVFSVTTNVVEENYNRQDNKIYSLFQGTILTEVFVVTTVRETIISEKNRD